MDFKALVDVAIGLTVIYLGTSLFVCPINLIVGGVIILLSLTGYYLARSQHPARGEDR